MHRAVIQRRHSLRAPDTHPDEEHSASQQGGVVDVGRILKNFTHVEDGGVPEVGADETAHQFPTLL